LFVLAVQIIFYNFLKKNNYIFLDCFDILILKIVFFLNKKQFILAYSSQSLRTPVEWGNLYMYLTSANGNRRDFEDPHCHQYHLNLLIIIKKLTWQLSFSTALCNTRLLICFLFMIYINVLQTWWTILNLGLTFHIDIHGHGVHPL